jgi:hypothetical protein
MSKAKSKQSSAIQNIINLEVTNLVTFNDVVLSIRLLKVASCPNNSGKSTLTYHVSCTSDNEIHLRITGNTGGGCFSPECELDSNINPLPKLLAICYC